MRRALLYAIGGYLALGMVFGLTEQPQQVWVCPDPATPHGESSHSERVSDACVPSVTAVERVAFFGLATGLWLPVAVLKGLAGG